MLYDGDCGFCAHFVQKWRRKTGESISYQPYQAAAGRFPQVNEAQCREAVQLILPGGKVFSGAHAVFKAMDLAGVNRLLHRLYDHLPLFGRFSEFFYQWVAHHRFLLSRLFFGSAKKC
ncbi:MAG: DUF393 domain-containing protein [Candidatus Sungbacteria bacterium]|uniref:DUF393 domain-containing protein n=1 Tax=Candidatus Sungiibacteriota bacterium TaxID=2750080 RepID=A0A933DTD5_9BACT|nr:DUF393 domain-containing protein [Candidatus Sungbacteria bacterium]